MASLILVAVTDEPDAITHAAVSGDGLQIPVSYADGDATNPMMDEMSLATDARDPNTADDTPLLREDKGHVAIFTLNRPRARNSLSEGLMAALQSAIDDITASSSVRACVLKANGPVFSAGHDLKELTAGREAADGGKAYFESIFAQCSKLMQSVVHCPKPIVAAVEGTATAAGAQLVASCDLAIAGQEARFATPGVNIGLFCSTPMVALSRNVARKQAMEMLLLGEMIPAERAREFGLINRVVSQEKVVQEAIDVAELIASKSPVTVAIGKEAFYRQLELPLSDAYTYTGDVMIKNMLHRDAQEGIGAFLDKRQPKWQDD